MTSNYLIDPNLNASRSNGILGDFDQNGINSFAVQLNCREKKKKLTITTIKWHTNRTTVNSFEIQGVESSRLVFDEHVFNYVKIFVGYVRIFEWPVFVVYFFFSPLECIDSNINGTVKILTIFASGYLNGAGAVDGEMTKQFKCV